MDKLRRIDALPLFGTSYLIAIGNMIVVKHRNEDLVDEHHDNDHQGNKEGYLDTKHICLGRNSHYGDPGELTGTTRGV